MPSRASEKLFERLRNTKAGWSDRDIYKLLSGYGFLSREGKHTVYSHRDYDDLSLTVPRSKQLKKIYPSRAEKLIDTLLARVPPGGKEK